MSKKCPAKPSEVHPTAEYLVEVADAADNIAVALRNYWFVYLNFRSFQAG